MLTTTNKRLQDLYGLNDIETNSNELVQSMVNEIIERKQDILIKKHLIK